MKDKTATCLTSVFILGAALYSCLSGATVAPARPGANLAVVAIPSASYVSGDTSTGALNDDATPADSADSRRGSYGNWPRTGTQWVEYDWAQPISTNRVDVYWWADGRGIRPPIACRLLYWNGVDFVLVGHAGGLGIAPNRFNTTTFDEVRTSRLRLEMDSDGTFSTGILQWRVIDTGKSPRFPPMVIAGPDRDVALGGKTYLNGSGRSVQDGAPIVWTWSKGSGPGRVTFDNARQSLTAARFSTPGSYVLKLTGVADGLRSTSTLKVHVTPAPPKTHAEPLRPTQWKLDSSFWNDRIKAVVVNWIPHCAEKLSELDLPEGGINNFIQAGAKLAGKSFTRRVGPPWSDAYVHNTVEAMCLALMLNPQGDPDLIAAQKAIRVKLQEWIPIILAAQEPDGYLQTYFTLSNRPRWTDRGAHEGYTGGYFIESAIADYLMSRRTDHRMYDAARKLADCWCANIGPAPKRTWYDGHEEMEQALVRLGRFVDSEDGPGKGSKYIRLARFLLDSRRGGTEYDQSNLPVTRQYEAEGHAVRAVYCYSGMTDIAMETGDLDYHSAVQSIWDNIVNKKYYVTGGVGSGETSEGFGPDYSLRNNSYCESCSSCGELFFQHNMLMAYGDSRYADLYEDTLYNAILGSLDLEGKNFYYQNPLNGGGPRYPWHGVPCCVGNIARTLLRLPSWMYTQTPDSINVALFIGSTVTLDDVSGTRVQMVQKTDYPWRGTVSITINPAETRRFTIRIRSPRRDDSELYAPMPASNGITSLTVNGRRVAPTFEKGFAVLTRTWNRGDVIRFELSLKIQRITASDAVAADKGRVALRVGPLIYNIESADQDINQVLSPNSTLTKEWRPDLLDGVMVVKGAFADGNALTAIPNYARNNRLAGAGRRGGSIVWFRDQ